MKGKVFAVIATVLVLGACFLAGFNYFGKYYEYFFFKN